MINLNKIKIMKWLRVII